ncbi:PAS domain S-box protein [Pelomyxa schiedti]|nr:PAS domain S-box protein [Pelomyxa schiedti]
MNRIAPTDDEEDPDMAQRVTTAPDVDVTEATASAKDTGPGDENVYHETHSAPSSGSSRSSNKTVSLTGITFKPLDFCSFACCQTVKASNFLALRLIVLFLELGQLLTFVLDDQVFCKYGSETNACSRTWKALFGIRHIRNFGATSSDTLVSEEKARVSLIISAVCTVIIYALSILQILLVVRGTLGSRRLYTLLHFIACIFPIVFMPLLSYVYIITDIVFCNQYIVWVIIQLSHLIIYSCNEFMPKRSILSVSQVWSRLLLSTCEGVLVFSDTFILPESRWGILTHCGLVVCTACLLFLQSSVFMPYFHKYIGGAFTAILAGIAFSSFFMFPGYYTSTFPLHAIAAAVFFLGIPAGLILHKILHWILYRIVFRLHFVKPQPFMIEQQIRSIYHLKGPTQTQMDHAEEILRSGMREFSDSQYLMVLYAIFLFDIVGNHSNATAWLEKVRKNSRTTAVVQYMRYCASTHKVDNVADHNMQLRLEIAQKHHMSAKRGLEAFWTHLMHSKNNALDVNFMLGIVSTLERHESNAEKMYRELVLDNPRSTLYLRQLAGFLKEIKMDFEEAEVLYLQADEYESRQQKATKPALRFAIEESEAAKIPRTHTEPLSEKSFDSRRYSVSSASDVSSMEKNALETYRQNIESSKSWSVERLRLALIGALAILLINIIVIYSVSTSSISHIHASIDEVEEATELSLYLGSSLHTVRQLQMQNEFGYCPGDPNSLYRILPEDLNMSRSLFDTSLSVADASLDRHIWTDTHLPTRIFVEYAYIFSMFYFSKKNQSGNHSDWSQSFYSRNSSLYEATTDICTSIDLLIPVLDPENTRDENLSFNPNFRFLMDNLWQTVVPKLLVLPDFRFKANDNLYSLMKMAVSIILPIVSVLFFIFVGFVYIPCEVALKRERLAIVNLFTEIPKSTIANIISTLTSDGVNNGLSALTYAKRKTSIISKLRILFMVSCLALLLLSCAMSFVVLFYATSGDGEDKVINSERRTELESQEMLFLANELILQDMRSWSSVEEIRQDYARAESEFILFSHELRYTRGIFDTMQSWMIELNACLADEAASVLEVSSIILNALLGISIPACLLFYVMSHFVFSTLIVEDTRTLQLLLAVPLNVLQGTAVIKQFFETGSVSGRAALKTAVEQQEKRTKMLLDGSKDAVVVVDEGNHIEIFNPSAERLFGYRADEVLGQSATVVLPGEIMGQIMERKAKFHHKQNKDSTPPPNLDDLEADITTKSGTVIPTLLSISEICSAQGATVAMFFKDISKLKAQEQALEQQKLKADMLLENILPKPVMDQLEAHPGKLIAQKYTSATIAFADIVEFTPLASNMAPGELVSMLNGLFCLWDSLLDIYNVEKVKTVGDCYMVVGGMPTTNSTHPEDVLEFAIAMFSALEFFNVHRHHKLRIRVGLNTGPVVAGVIGKKKWAFDLWGDAVNLASRLESTGVPNRIQVSQHTQERLSNRGYTFEGRGLISIKGKGDIDCFLLDEPKANQAKKPLPPDFFAGSLCEMGDEEGWDMGGKVFSHSPSVQLGSPTVPRCTMASLVPSVSMSSNL